MLRPIRHLAPTLAAALAMPALLLAAGPARDIKPAMADTAWNGRNSMPSFRGVLTAEQLRDVLHYVSQDLFKAAP
jgi:mono/diheme cytochrome c family protein